MAIGKYRGVSTRTNVVQTMTLFCGQPDENSEYPQGMSSFPELKGVYGANPCKGCVAFHASHMEAANLPVPRYNCSFYTLSYINRTAPAGVR
jgi:hypothetical protein